MPEIPAAHKEVARWYFLASLLWFFAASFIGLLLRYYHYEGTLAEIIYKYWKHAHSHVIMLGWVYNALAALLLWTFPMNEHARFHRVLFLFSQIFVAGMLITFPLHGYFWASILFSTLHIFAGYAFALRLFTDTRILKNTSMAEPLRWLRLALFFLVFSSLGPFLVAYIMASHREESIWYRLFIYFYIHFQANGWFLVAAIAAVLAYLRYFSGVVKQKAGSLLPLWLIASGVVLSYGQSAIWTHPPQAVYFAAWAGALLQLAGLILLGLREQKTLVIAYGKGFYGQVLTLAAALLLFKSFLQLAMLFGPGFQSLAAEHAIVIAFLHLLFLGIITPFLLIQAAISGLAAPFDRWSKKALIAFLFFFSITEFLLVLPPLFPATSGFLSSPRWLFYATLMMVLSLWILLFRMYTLFPAPARLANRS